MEKAKPQDSFTPLINQAEQRTDFTHRGEVPAKFLCSSL